MGLVIPDLLDETMRARQFCKALGLSHLYPYGTWRAMSASVIFHPSVAAAGERMPWPGASIHVMAKGGAASCWIGKCMTPVALLDPAVCESGPLGAPLEEA